MQVSGTCRTARRTSCSNPSSGQCLQTLLKDLFHYDVRVHSQNLVLLQSLLRHAHKKILRVHDALPKPFGDFFLATVRAADAAATVATGCCLDMVTCWQLLRADCQTEVPKNTTSCCLHYAFPSVMLTVFRNPMRGSLPHSCFASTCFRPHRCASIPCLWRTCSVACASMASTGIIS